MYEDMSARGGSAFGGKLSIIIPAHNEQATIAQALEKVFSVDLQGWDKEVIVIDDGSSDNTKNILDGISSNYDGRHNLRILDFVVIHHDINFGKGAAIQTGLRRASGDYVIIQDADAEYDPEDIPNLLSAIESPHPNPPPQGEGIKKRFLPLEGGGKGGGERKVAVFGARGYKAYPERGFHYVIGAWVLTTFFNILYHQKLTDLYTCYKLIPTSVFKSLNIQSNGFEFEAEVACKLARANVKIIEVPISYQPRNKDQGKHIRFIDAIKGFWMIIKLRFL